MTDTKSKTTSKPAFYIFERDKDGNTQRVGAAFNHAKGKGLNIVIGDRRYVAYPPKAGQTEGA